MSLPALALTLVRALPVSPAVLLARLAVLAYLLFSRSARVETGRNHRILFGRERVFFWVENGWQVGRNLALMARQDGRQGQFLIDKAEVSGDNQIQQSMEQLLHMTMASFHFGAWEFLPAVFRARGHLVALAVGRQADRAFDRRLRGTRTRPGVRLIRGAAELVAGRSGLVGFMLDNTSRGRMVLAEADGVRMRMPGPAFRLAGRTGVVPLFCSFERGRLRVRVYPAGDAGHALRCLLAEVRRRPADWVFWGKAGALEAA
ncbi:MAG: hypothetical protein R6X12_03680 [bacterium]